MSHFALRLSLGNFSIDSTQSLSKEELGMTPSQLKVLILLIVLVFAAVMLAGWTWDDGAALAAAVQ